MHLKGIILKTVTALLVAILLVAVITWIRISRKFVQVAFNHGLECTWQLNQWYSGRSVLSCYEQGVRKGVMRASKGLFDWPIAAFPGPLPNTVIAIHELDTTVAVFTIDLTRPNVKGISPPVALASTVLFSNFKVRPCTQGEVRYLRDYISHLSSPCNSTFPLNDCRADPETLKRGLLRAVDMGTIPNDQRTGDFRYDAQPQILPEGE
jgi:hypothetical protein